VASQLAIINVCAECLPSNKAAKIKVRSRRSSPRRGSGRMRRARPHLVCASKGARDAPGRVLLWASNCVTGSQ